MHHPNLTQKGYIQKEKQGKGLLQTEATYTAEKINIANYLNTNYADDYFVNTVKGHENNQPNMN